MPNALEVPDIVRVWCYAPCMALNSTARRRWFGVAVLAAALGMLVAGETVLQGRLGPVTFILYWLACMALTLLAVIVAFLDARALRQRSREEHTELFKSTLQSIEAEARNRARTGSPRRRVGSNSD